jgi:Astacin (Peptidase family M12A)
MSISLLRVTTGTALFLAIVCPRTAITLNALGIHPGPVVSGSKNRWPGGLIPYTFAPSVSALLRARVDSAIAQIEARVFGVTFRPRSGESDFVIFRPAATCSSEVEGREGGASVVWLSDTCVTGGVMHELLHVLGFWHEQSRCDRDQYVSIIWSNIDPTRLARDQFEKRCHSTQDLEAYDEASIMHYADTAFGVNRGADGALLKTMESRRGRGYLMGQRDSLSTIDIRTINLMYPPYVPGVSVAYGDASPIVSWEAPRGALSFTVALVVVHRGYKEGSSSIVWESIPGGEDVTGLSIVDRRRRYTGTSRCDGDGFSVDYYYEVRALYSDGIGTSGTRVPALIAPERPC